MALLSGEHHGASVPSLLLQTANDPAPSVAVAVAAGAVPVLVVTCPSFVWVKTDPVISLGAADTVAAVPSTVVT